MKPINVLPYSKALYVYVVFVDVNRRVICRAAKSSSFLCGLLLRFDVLYGSINYLIFLLYLRQGRDFLPWVVLELLAKCKSVVVILYRN